MKILITGCAGFIGSHLCERLLTTTDFDIYGIDNLNDYYNVSQKTENLRILSKYSKFNFKKDDIITTNEITIIKPDIVVNIAAMAGVRYSLENPTIYMRTNVEGHVHLMNECVKNNVNHYVYASSSSVYGNNTKVPFSEEDEIKDPNSPYAASKTSGEIMAKLYNKLYGLSVIGLRFFTVYGPRGRPDMAPFKFLSKIMNEEKFDKYGEGNTYRDYTYIDDIVSGIVGAILNKKNKTCEVYNLGNSNTVTLNEFIKTCEDVTGKKANFNQLPEQPGDVPKTYSDITKAINDLDYCPKTNLFEGLSKMYEWLKN
jgi:UDP-glucuronate 4-epimerase